MVIIRPLCLTLTLVTKMKQVLDQGSRITLEGEEEAGTIEDLIVVSTIVEVEVMAVQEAMDMDMVMEEVIITMVTVVGVGNKT